MRCLHIWIRKLQQLRWKGVNSVWSSQKSHRIFCWFEILYRQSIIINSHVHRYIHGCLKRAAGEEKKIKYWFIVWTINKQRSGKIFAFHNASAAEITLMFHNHPPDLSQHLMLQRRKVGSFIWYESKGTSFTLQFLEACLPADLLEHHRRLT